MSLVCVYVGLVWIVTCSCCRVHHHHDARVTVRDHGIARTSFKHTHSDVVKLVGSSNSDTIYAGSPETLFTITTEPNLRVKQVPLGPFKDKCNHKPTCSYSISLLSEGVNGNLLFLCETTVDTVGEAANTHCCHMMTNHSLTDCFDTDYELHIKEPSLLIGDMLYFTNSNMKSEVGVFRINDKKDRIWPQSTQTEQKYVKLIAGTDQHQDKVYTFFTEKQKLDSGSHLWVPRVSQICKNDRGGPKDHLQFSWTSMISARLFCGGEEREFIFTRLIDVATVEVGNDIEIYALFRNYWNISAVCVYRMSTITHVFSSSEFNIKVPQGHRPGECVNDSTRLSDDLLKFMKEHPEVKDQVKPVNGPLLFQHRHYTHIQVDKVWGHTVLFLSLESGRIHKVWNSSFVIAEYLPFPHRANITSMLLDSSKKRLYVSSGNEMAQIDLQRCDEYGNDCESCVLSKDPYCSWNGSKCAPTKKHSVQDLTSCLKPQAAESKTVENDKPPELNISKFSSYYLLCPTISHHATYHWYHGNTQQECVYTEKGCLYLIEGMNQTHEGVYRCVSSEGGYNRTVVQYQLSVSGSEQLRVQPTVLLCLLVLLAAFHFLLYT